MKLYKPVNFERILAEFDNIFMHDFACICRAGLAREFPSYASGYCANWIPLMAEEVVERYFTIRLISKITYQIVSDQKELEVILRICLNGMNIININGKLWPAISRPIYMKYVAYDT